MQNPLVYLRRKARSLPQGSGVYLMKDRLGQVIYVGKAKNLRRRVATYFQKSRRYVRSQPKIAAMVEMARDLEIVETKGEAEALLLEGKLIKEYRPKYNTDFVDDKQFLLVRVDLQNALPRFRLTRNKKDEKSRYYGPFARTGMLRDTLSEMRKRFGIQERRNFTLEEVGRYLTLTRERIRQIEAKALEKLRVPHRATEAREAWGALSGTDERQFSSVED